MNAKSRPILIVTTSHGAKGDTGEPTGFFLSEVTHPLAVFEEAGLSVAYASIAGGEPPVDGLDLEDATNARYWNDDAFRAAIRGSARLADVNPEDYGAIFFAGGHGAMWDFPANTALIAKTRAIWEAGGAVGAVCHGPAALVDVTLRDGTFLVGGRRVAAFTDSEERAVELDTVVPFLLSSRLAKRGALLQPAPDWSANIAVDGRLVTGQNPQSATGVGEALRDLILAPSA
jgi:putative intracellular protease/amidase